MWMLSFIPDTWISLAIHAIFLLGIIGLILGKVLKNIPFVSAYGIAIAGISFVFLLVGTYFEGGVGVEKEWRQKVENLQEKVKLAEAQSAKVNTVIQTKIVEKTKIIKEITEGNIQYVDKIITKYDNVCTLSNALVLLHNGASQNVLATSSGDTNEGTSKVKASDLIRTVTENYGTYYQTREQVIGWQEWYKEQRRVYEGVK